MSTIRKLGLEWKRYAPNNGVVRFEATVPTPENLSLECLTIYECRDEEQPFEAMYDGGLGYFATFRAAEVACVNAALTDCEDTIALYNETVKNLKALLPRNEADHG